MDKLLKPKYDIDPNGSIMIKTMSCQLCTNDGREIAGEADIYFKLLPSPRIEVIINTNKTIPFIHIDKFKSIKLSGVDLRGYFTSVVKDNNSTIAKFILSAP